MKRLNDPCDMDELRSMGNVGGLVKVSRAATDGSRIHRSAQVQVRDAGGVGEGVVASFSGSKAGGRPRAGGAVWKEVRRLSVSFAGSCDVGLSSVKSVEEFVQCTLRC